ncbi:hypothetical protein HGB41_17670 [Massilia sp. ML15P13]|uniref:Uncharacterized protein n=1 Tax=Telluria aromaticivorans TaxID=2725995 RepID=A0A7Y2K184_9BURK|nr:hypothetical protein [Telluria aromaticivorans]
MAILGIEKMLAAIPAYARFLTLQALLAVFSLSESGFFNEEVNECHLHLPVRFVTLQF